MFAIQRNARRRHDAFLRASVCTRSRLLAPASPAPAVAGGVRPRVRAKARAQGLVICAKTGRSLGTAVMARA